MIVMSQLIRYLAASNGLCLDTRQIRKTDKDISWEASEETRRPLVPTLDDTSRGSATPKTADLTSLKELVFIVFVVFIVFIVFVVVFFVFVVVVVVVVQDLLTSVGYTTIDNCYCSTEQ